ncbi:MAG: hypothetical protein CEN87_530 [Parcubacteria group bacterium Licking1014_1]|nr:MAG: hypothetical protein CEN87_530 [Parcubacteria group bacterium Licking1014_1]
MREEAKKYFNIFGKFLGLILLILLIISFYKFLNISGFFNSEITEYPVVCKEEPVLNQCNNPEYTLRKTTYKVIYNRQEVIYWTEDFSTQRLTRCAIKDKKNWSCKYDDESAEFGFTDGKYWNYSLIPSAGDDLWKNVYYPSRIKYLMVQCENNTLCFLFANLFY